MSPVGFVQVLVVLLLVALVTSLVTRPLRVPYTLGLVVVGVVIAAIGLLPGVRLTPQLVLGVFLPGLLFEGAWSLDVAELRRVWLSVALLAGPGLLLTVAICSVVLHFGAALAWGPALLLGAILAPTDPVAVLGLFRDLGVGERLRTTVEGESLFNDGVASVLYLVALGLVLQAQAGRPIVAGSVTTAFVAGIFRLAVAGAALGMASGFLIARALRLIDDARVETTITLVAAYGVYLVADAAQVSGILAVVTLGLVVGHYGRRVGMSQRTADAVDTFWAEVAFIANALLFLLIGAQVSPRAVFGPGGATLAVVSAWAIAAVLGGRAFAVYALLPVTHALRLPGAASWPPVLLWAGLRGALSLALALALPLSLPDRPLLVAATDAVVLFTLLVQGLSLRLVLRRLGFTGEPR